MNHYVIMKISSRSSTFEAKFWTLKSKRNYNLNAFWVILSSTFKESDIFDSFRNSFVRSAIYPKLYCHANKVRLKILNLEVLKEYFFFILEVTFKGIMTQHSRRIFLACISISKEDFSLLDTNGSSKS